jgi:hypothetical protein
MSSLLSSGDYYDLTTPLIRHSKKPRGGFCQTCWTYKFTVQKLKAKKALYYPKGSREHTLMKPFGEIYFKREYYVPKNGVRGEGFFFVDRKLKRIA